jgi:predicted ATPase/class 3 adenylate cyclase
MGQRSLWKTCRMVTGAPPPSGAVTFLFTDIEGSTRRWETHTRTMGGDLAAHDEVLRVAIESHDGWLFKHTGDGVCAAFQSAQSAVDAAIDAQRLLKLPVRMGIATGEVERRRDDYFGPALNRAARVMAAGHGGQILVSGSTAALLGGVDLRDLGEHRLRDLSGFDRLHQVRAAGLADEFPDLRTTKAAPELVSSHVELLGRDREASEIQQRLQSRRLVTIVGPGGIGKTALARHALGEVGIGGAVDLTSISTDDAVGGAIASQLGHPSFEALLVSPAPVTPVLIDNCEHVVAGVASVVDRVLESGPDWRLLATSRSPLNATAESVFALGPLPNSWSCALFLARARDAGVEIDVEEAGIAEIIDGLCRRLDGVPLAIEIAAARTRVMTPISMLEHLQAGVDVLARPRYRGPARHRSVRETIAWSYALLDDAERSALDRLSVCAGPFDLGLAGAVIGPEDDVARGVGQPTPGVLDLLETLAEASLVAVDSPTGASPYRLLETIRSFAFAQLETAGERRATEDRFIVHVVDTVLGIMEQGRPGWTAEVLGELLAKYDNVATALSLCLQRDSEATRSLLLCSVLWGVVHNGHVDDVAQLGRETLDRWPDPQHPLWPDAVATLATATLIMGDIDAGVALAESAMPHSETSAFAPATLRRVLGLAAQSAGDHLRAATIFADASRAARTSGAAALAMEADVLRGQALSLAGRHDEALEVVRSARSEAESGHWHINSVFASIVEGLVVLNSDPDSAWALLEDSLGAARAANYPWGVTASLQSMAYACLRQGRDDAAVSTIVELVDEMRASPSDWSRADPLGPVAALMHRRGMVGWEDMAATAEWRARTGTLPAAGLHLLDLPAARGRVLPARQATDMMLAVLMSVDTPAGNATEPVRTPSAHASFVLDGEMWSVSFRGSSVHLKASKGMRDLAELLAHPGVEIHCLDLAGAAVEETSTGDVLDATARRQYEDRLRELQVVIDEAESHSDHIRAERAQTEFDAIVDHLTAGLGLSRQSRRHVDTTERARSAVTQRIRGSIKRIETAHAHLGAHLRSSIQTGTFCCYRPETPTHWSVRTRGLDATSTPTRFAASSDRPDRDSPMTSPDR